MVNYVLREETERVKVHKRENNLIWSASAKHILYIYSHAIDKLVLKIYLIVQC